MGMLFNRACLPLLLAAGVSAGGCAVEPDGGPCSALEDPEDFAACPALCDESTATGVACQLAVPDFPSGAFSTGHELFFDKAKTGIDIYPDWSLGYWRMGETGKGLVEILELPFFIGVPSIYLRDRHGLYHAVPSNHPPPRLRAASPITAAGITPMSLYMRYLLADEMCVVEVASVTTWTLRESQSQIFAEYERASLVLAKDEACEGHADFERILAGQAWKTQGVMYRVSKNGVEGGGILEACGRDEWCNMECRFDFDCACHHDGVCSFLACPGDLDCGCGQDSYCVLWCDADPDCLCIADDVCSQACGSLDPDCNCAPDASCSCPCLKDDPDCGCLPDGECGAVCGWVDEDCRCEADGLCNEPCETQDPDCG
jgi:hypothetical protein